MSGLCFSQANQNNFPGTGGGTGTVTSIVAGSGLSGGTITGSGTIAILTAYQLPQACSNLQIPQWSTGGGNWVCASAGTGTLTSSGTPTANQAPSWTTATNLIGFTLPAGSVYAGIVGGTVGSLTWPLLDTRADPGANLCLRIQDQAIAGLTQTISAQGEVSNAVSVCGPQDINPNLTGLSTIASEVTYRYKLKLNGGTQLQTDTGLTQGAFQQIEAQIADVSGVTANVNTSGFVIKAGANFPTNCTVTATGVTGNNFITLILSGGGACTEPLNISPGSRLTNGDSVAGGYYFISKCTGITAPCIETGLPGGVGSGTWSQWYFLPINSSIVLNIEPPLVSTFTATAMTYLPAIHEIGDVVAQNTGQVGISDTDTWLSGAEIFGGVLSAGQCMGLFSIFGQENSRYQDDAVSSCRVGIVLAGGDSGAHKNLNVGFGSDAKCGPSHTVPLEIWAGPFEVSRVTVNGNNCTASKEDSGLIHVTNNPINTTGGGVLNVHDLHMEGGSPGTTLDGILIDTAHTTATGYPLANQQTGEINLYNVVGCPSGASTCTNVVHVASNFLGNLHFHDSACNGSTNAIQDDINGNTMLCSNNTGGLGFYRINSNKIASTDFNCVDMTKGWCLDNGLWNYYVGGVVVSGINGPTGALTGKSVVLNGATSGSATLSATGTGGTLNLGSANATVTAAGAPTFAGLVQTAASATGTAGLNLPHGSAPTSPVNGDFWSTTTGFFGRVNGTTVGPFAAAGGSVWSALTNPSGNLSLTMGSNTSIFNTTTALSQFFAWKNTTAALVGTSQGSPVTAVCGRAFHGSADVEACSTWSILPGNGNDAAITVNYGYTGTSTGVVTSQFPGPVAAGSSGGAGGIFTAPEGTTSASAAASDSCGADSTAHALKCSFNADGPYQMSRTIASGTSAMGTGAITSGTCATAVTTSATGTATTDTIVATPNADPTGVTGYAVSATGSLYIQSYPTANNVNFKVCNNTSGSLTPSALTLNWKVIR